jgi:hypothetical protein
LPAVRPSCEDSRGGAPSSGHTFRICHRCNCDTCTFGSGVPRRPLASRARYVRASTGTLLLTSLIIRRRSTCGGPGTAECLRRASFQRRARDAESLSPLAGVIPLGLFSGGAVIRSGAPSVVATLGGPRRLLAACHCGENSGPPSAKQARLIALNDEHVLGAVSHTPWAGITTSRPPAAALRRAQTRENAWHACSTGSRGGNSNSTTPKLRRLCWRIDL